MSIWKEPCEGGSLLERALKKDRRTCASFLIVDAQGVKGILGDRVGVQIVKRNELHKFEVIPKRWVVERSFAWLENCRRQWKNCERKIVKWVHEEIMLLSH